MEAAGFSKTAWCHHCDNSIRLSDLMTQINTPVTTLLQMEDYCGTSYSSCWMTRPSVTPTI